MTTSFLSLTGYWKKGDDGSFHLVKVMDHCVGKQEHIYDISASNRLEAFWLFTCATISHLNPCE